MKAQAQIKLRVHPSSRPIGIKCHLAAEVLTPDADTHHSAQLCFWAGKVAVIDPANRALDLTFPSAFLATWLAGCPTMNEDLLFAPPPPPLPPGIRTRHKHQLLWMQARKRCNRGASTLLSVVLLAAAGVHW